MKRQELVELAGKLGVKVPAKASMDRIDGKIAAHLEEEGLSDDVELTDGETEYLTELGFEFDSEGEDDEGEESEEEENEEEDPIEGEEDKDEWDEDPEDEAEIEEDDEGWESEEEDESESEDEDEEDLPAEPVKSKPKAKAKKEAKPKSAKPKTKSDEKSSTSKRTWNSRKEMIPVIEKFIRKTKKGRTRAEVLEHVQEKFPEATKKQVYDLLSYGKNPKYKPFTDLLVENEKCLSFAG